MGYAHIHKTIKYQRNSFWPNQYQSKKSGNPKGREVEVCDLNLGDVFLDDEGKKVTVSAIQKSDDKVTIWAEGADSPMVFKPEPHGGLVLKKVTNVFRGIIYEWLHVITSTGEDIPCTRDHPFYVKEKGYVAAIDLQENDQFLTAARTYS